MRQIQANGVSSSSFLSKLRPQRETVCFSQEEKRKMKEEIERRRAQAAEKRQKVEDATDGAGKPFKCVSPRGSSLKVSVPRPVACYVHRTCVDG